MSEFPYLRIVSCIMLLMLTSTYCYLCISQAQLIPVADNLLWGCGVLLSGNAGQLLADKFMPRK